MNEKYMLLTRVWANPLSHSCYRRSNPLLALVSCSRWLARSRYSSLTKLSSFRNRARAAVKGRIPHFCRTVCHPNTPRPSNVPRFEKDSWAQAFYVVWQLTNGTGRAFPDTLWSANLLVIDICHRLEMNKVEWKRQAYKQRLEIRSIQSVSCTKNPFQDMQSHVDATVSNSIYE